MEPDQKMSGKLYGVGLGPGDPDLMTLRAARLVAGARVLAYPVLEGGASFARAIAARHIAPDAVEIPINIPMSVARAPAQAAYDVGACCPARCPKPSLPRGSRARNRWSS